MAGEGGDGPYDDWYDDDRDDRPGMEEPNYRCMACCDSGTVRAGRLASTVGRPWVRCPYCNPNRLTRLSGRVGLPRVRAALARWRQRNVVYSDEPPF